MFILCINNHVLSSTTTRWLSDWWRISSSYFTRHILGSIPDAGISGNTFISIFNPERVDWYSKTTNWSPSFKKIYIYLPSSHSCKWNMKFIQLNEDHGWHFKKVIIHYVQISPAPNQKLIGNWFDLSPANIIHQHGHRVIMVKSRGI